MVENAFISLQQTLAELDKNNLKSKAEKDEICRVGYYLNLNHNIHNIYLNRNRKVYRPSKKV